jgi:putative NADH-flavin reductase
VLGATGGTGREIVQQLKARGHSPVALVRSTVKAEELGAALFPGDARDEAVLFEALVGCDAVISALGTPPSPFREVTLLSAATRALVAAMSRRGVKRLVCITGIGAGDTRGHGGFAFDWLILPLLLRNVYADKDRQEAIIAQTNLDWVLVRPTILNDKPRRGNIRALVNLAGFHGGKIARGDVAAFVVDQLASNAFVGKRPLITW